MQMYDWVGTFILWFLIRLSLGPVKLHSRRFTPLYAQDKSFANGANEKGIPVKVSRPCSSQLSSQFMGSVGLVERKPQSKFCTGAFKQSAIGKDLRTQRKR